MSDHLRSDAGRSLAEAAAALRRDAAAVRRAFQRTYDAADPVPGVEEARRLAQVLETAAAEPPVARDRVLRAEVRPSDLDLLEQTAALLERPVLTQDAAERQTRASLARHLRAAHVLIWSARASEAQRPAAERGVEAAE